MRSLQLINGDLALGQGGYAEITGISKVQQDLVVAIITPYGSNQFHPTWGSVLENMIGSPQTASTGQVITNEIKRVIGNIIATQTLTLQMAQSNGYVSPYGNDDLITSVGQVTTTSAQDVITVSAEVSTASSSSTTLSTSVSQTGVTGVTS